MSVKVFIKRRTQKENEKELFACIRLIRNLVHQQPGYISGEYLRSIEYPNEIVTISTWFSYEDWQTWFNSSKRREIQAQIDAIPGVKTEYDVYRYIKSR